MKLSSRKRKLIVGGVAAAMLAGAIGAFAFFTSTGSGTGSATVGTATAWSVTETATSGGPLFPDPAVGGPNIQTVSYTVTNPSLGSQSLASVTVTVSNPSTPFSVQTDLSKPACTAADFSVGGQAAGAAFTDTSAAGDFTAGQSKTEPVKVELIDNGLNQDNCQGVTVPLLFRAS